MAKRSHYAQELEWVMETVKLSKADYESAVEKADKEVVTPSTIAMCDYYRKKPGNIPDLISKYHKMREVVSRKEESGAGSDYLGERAVQVCKHFLKGALHDLDIVAGFPGHGRLAQEYVLQACTKVPDGERQVETESSGEGSEESGPADVDS